MSCIPSLYGNTGYLSIDIDFHEAVNFKRYRIINSVSAIRVFFDEFLRFFACPSVALAKAGRDLLNFSTIKRI